MTDHMRQLRYHAGEAFTTVLANDRYNAAQPPYQIGEWVTLPSPTEAIDYRLFTGDVVDEVRSWHHNPQKLAARLMAVYTELAGAASK
ncbi:MAG: hypothetical protein R3E79_16990 [Caldilineaceae bacterium]